MNETKLFKEDHSMINLKIVWSLLLNGLAGAVLLYSYLKGFKDTKVLLAIASPVYIVLMSFFQYWSAHIAIPTFYRGQAKSLQVWLTSEIQLPSADYVLKPFVGDSAKGKAGVKMHSLPIFKTCIGNWITADGFVDAAAVEADLEKLDFSLPKRN